MADLNRDDWKKNAPPGHDGGWWPPSDVDVTDLDDYTKWQGVSGGWAVIEAMVLGGSGLKADQVALAHANVNPESLTDASGRLRTAFDALTWMETFIRDHSKAIAGPGKAWQGAAADAFVAKMDNFADRVGAEVERLSGSDGRGNVSDQLDRAANHLAFAQQSMIYLDQSYARLAYDSNFRQDNGIGTGGKVGDDGNVSITGSEFETPMAEQMTQVVGALANQYASLSFDAAIPPTGDGSPPVTTPNLSKITPPNISIPNMTPPPNAKITAPNLSNITPPNASNFTQPNLSNITPPNPAPPVFNAPNLPGAPPNAPGPNFDPPKLPSAPNAPSGGLPGFDPPTVGGGPNGSNGAIPPFVPPVLPGAPGSDGSNGAKSPSGAGPGFKAPVLPKAPDGDPVGANSFQPPKVPAPPVAGNVNGIGKGVDVPGAGSPGGIGGAPGGGAPGGGAPGGGGVGLPDAPDASGLLTGDKSDFQSPTVGLPEAPDAPGGAHPGGAGLGSGLGGGMPGGGMPGGGMPGGGSPGEGGGVNLPDAPDANGLLSGDATDWQAPDVRAVDGPASPGGASPGGAGLGSGQPGAGMPMSPGGAPASGGTELPESPDAGGLLSGDAADWHSDLASVDGPSAPVGADAGGSGLTETVPAMLPIQSGPLAPPERRDNARSDAADGPGEGEPETADQERKREAAVPLPYLPVDLPTASAAGLNGNGRLGAAILPIDPEEGVLMRAHSADAESENQPAIPAAVALLAEDAERWASDREDLPVPAGADRVPLVRPAGAGADTASWDDGGDSWWLPSGDDTNEGDKPDA